MHDSFYPSLSLEANMTQKKATFVTDCRLKLQGVHFFCPEVLNHELFKMCTCKIIMNQNNLLLLFYIIKVWKLFNIHIGIISTP